MDEKELMEQTGAEETLEETADENINEIDVQTTASDDLVVNAESDDEFTEIVDEEFTEISQEIDDDFVYAENDETAEEISFDNKKDFVIQKPILIACCILLCSIIAFGGFMVYSKLFGSSNFIGTWVRMEEASADEATKDHKGNGVTYFTFDNDGKATMTVGTMTVIGEWNYNQEDRSKVDIGISYFFGGTFDVEVKGNIFTGKNLVLKDTYGSVYDFKSTRIPNMYAEQKKDVKKIDEKVLGTWSNQEIGITYVFRADGTCSINESGIILIEGVFATEKDKIMMSFVSNETTDTNFDYKINKDGTAVIGGYQYTKENSK